MGLLEKLYACALQDRSDFQFPHLPDSESAHLDARRKRSGLAPVMVAVHDQARVRLLGQIVDGREAVRVCGWGPVAHQHIEPPE